MGMCKQATLITSRKKNDFLVVHKQLRQLPAKALGDKFLLHKDGDDLLVF